MRFLRQLRQLGVYFVREMYHLAGSGIESKISGIGKMVATTIVPYII